MAVTLNAMLGGESSGWAVTFITFAIITTVTIIHITGIRIVSLVNNLGVYAELAEETQAPREHFPRATAATGIIVLISIFACAVASMATATRLLFSMSRDNMLPFSSFMAKVNDKRQIPQIAALVIWVFSTLIVLSFRRIELITSVGALATYMGYSGIMLSTLMTRKKLKVMMGFSLGKWRKTRQLLSLLWTCMVVAAISIPKTDIPGVKVKRLPALLAAVAAVTGALLYLFFVKGKIAGGLAGPPKKVEI